MQKPPSCFFQKW